MHTHPSKSLALTHIMYPSHFGHLGLHLVSLHFSEPYPASQVSHHVTPGCPKQLGPSFLTSWW